MTDVSRGGSESSTGQCRMITDDAVDGADAGHILLITDSLVHQTNTATDT